MNEKDFMNFKKETSIIDPVRITNNYALYSTFKSDTFFQNNQIIFCGGIIEDIGENVYNFYINEFVGYLSFQKELNFNISSNLILKVDEDNKPLLCSFEQQVRLY